MSDDEAIYAQADDAWIPEPEPDVEDYPDDPQNDPEYLYGQARSNICFDDAGLVQLANGINAAIATKVCREMKQLNPNSDPAEFKPDFFDAQGLGVIVPKDDGKEYFNIGYAMMLWDLMQGNLFQGRTLDGEDDGQLYRRAVDYRSGRNKVLQEWKAIDLQSSYGIPRRDWNDAWTRQMLFETSRLTLRVLHGIRFRNVAFLRESSETDGGIRRLTAEHQQFHWPYELSIDMEYNGRLVTKAADWAKFLTDDDSSARNFIRFFATPLMEPYKHLSYVWYGEGGNGKGIIAGALKHTFPDLACTVDAQKLLGGRRGAGGFGTDNEIVKLLGRLWAVDDDADDISVEQMTNLKKISTGDPLSARRIQENTIEVRPKATFLICTNNSVVMSSNAAALRRQCFVRMRDHRKAEEFTPLRKFLKEYGIAPFIMASCQYWEKYGDTETRRVTIGDFKDLTPAEIWYVDEIVQHGYAVYQDCPVREDSVEHKNSVAKLGLMSKVKRLDRGGDKPVSMRVLVVGDEKVFGVYRRHAEKDYAEASGKVEAKAVAAPAKPLSSDRASMPLPDELGFDCDYVPAGVDKVAKNWQKRVEDPNYDTTKPPQDGPYGIVPKPGYVVVDIDRSKHEGVPDGWDLLCGKLGEYGSAAFPKTYLVRTPSGGLHAYYRIPDEIRDTLKNIAHPTTAEFPRKVGGTPVDMRCSGKGYVVGPGSIVNAGRYELVGLPPEGEAVPDLSPAMVDWLKANGYVEGVEPPKAPAPRTLPAYVARGPHRAGARGRAKSLQDMNLDMSAVGEGARNDTLFRWACGLMVDHADEADYIHRVLEARGRTSGLKDAEIEQIWKSVQRTATASA